MPTYRVTNPQTGQTLKVTGDTPPNEQELDQIFGATSKPSLTTGQKVANFAGKAAPIVMGGVGALAGSVLGPGGTIAGSAGGVAVGRGIQEELKNLTGQQTKNDLEQLKGVAKDTAVDAAVTAGTLGLGKLLKPAGEIIKETVKPIAKGGLPSLTKGLSSPATKAAASSSQKFSRPMYWADLADEITGMTPQEQVKNIPKFFQRLAADTGMDAKTLSKYGIDNIKDVIPQLKFRGGSTTSVLEGLGLRRDAAKAAFDSKTTVSRLIETLFGISKKDPMALAQNRAFNSQIQKVLGVKKWDKVVSLYKSPIGTQARNYALYKLLKPLFPKLSGGSD